MIDPQSTCQALLDRMRAYEALTIETNKLLRMMLDRDADDGARDE